MKLITTSVVRGSRQGESHGGVYLIDLEARSVTRVIDWNKADIDWQGRGWDRGLRGIAFDGETVYIAASDELFVYDREFRMLESFRCPYLRHCHEISRCENLLFLTSTGYDSLLAFDLDQRRFAWGLHLARDGDGWTGRPFDPDGADGPAFGNALHINMVHATRAGIFTAGLRTRALLRIDGRLRISEVCSLPAGAHNARPFRNGVLFNDTEADCVRYVGRDGFERAFHVPVFDPATLEHVGIDDSRIARQGFARGLCPLGDGLVAAGSSPSTVCVYDIDSGRRIAAVTLSMDIRNAIHGLEIWPFD